MLNEARQKLANVARDPTRYAALIDGLVLQVSFKHNDFIYKPMILKYKISKI